eukprot:gb/GFBE01015455.1/.p1 GENE.gb/GFBE01015455.1/~~gb/GFBE01015455.1/.p1  ORF type:complete len:172 (+),score=36.66 gb/GFBE01015455.1/:1-516(+)
MAEEHTWNGVNALMLKNIPCRVRYDELMDVVGELGFADSLVSLSLPTKTQSKRNSGYAFIRFATPKEAQRFRDAMDGYSFESRPSTKKVQVVVANVQGVRSSKDKNRAPDTKKQEPLPLWNGAFFRPPPGLCPYDANEGYGWHHDGLSTEVSDDSEEPPEHILAVLGQLSL